MFSDGARRLPDRAAEFRLRDRRGNPQNERASRARRTIVIPGCSCDCLHESFTTLSPLCYREYTTSTTSAWLNGTVRPSNTQTHRALEFKKRSTHETFRTLYPADRGSC